VQRKIMPVSLRPSLEPYKVEKIWLVMVVDLSPYKLLMPPHCVLRSFQSEENAVQMQMLWAVHSNGPPIRSRFAEQ
jgi:hypothetical protein